LVQGIGEDQWDRPTPCAEWDVRTLVNHVVSENLWVAPLLQGRTIEDVGDRFEGDQLGDDPVGAYERSAVSARSAAEEPGALQRPVAVSYGPVPGAEYLGHRLMDLLVHGWDLAAATGQDRTMDAEALDVLWPILEPQVPALAATPFFGPPIRVVDERPLADRVLGALGRDAGWSPPV
jgi:uncharacterized protein (TIGR03086 family)